MDEASVLLYNQAMASGGTTHHQKVGAVIAAAGRSQRMGGMDKMFLTLGGKPLLARAVETFQRCRLVDQIVLVLSRQNLKPGQELVEKEGWSKVSKVCLGSGSRQESVARGLKALGSCHWVVIHDGARPLVTEELIIEGLEQAKETGAAVAAVPVTDTIKVADSDRFVQDTPARHKLWAVQTPQVFRFDVIFQAYRQAKGEVTDDASLVEALGFKVKLYPGSYDNIKITTQNDLTLAEVLLKEHGK